MKFYIWLYMHIGGRPWTWILRDSWVDIEIVWIACVLIIGSAVGVNWNLIDRISIRDLLIGYLLAHLFWGTRQIYHQGLKGEKHGRKNT